MKDRFTPAVVDHLGVNLLPHLSEKQEAEFRVLVARYRRSWDHLQQLQNYINDQTTILGEELNQTLIDYQQIENEILQTRAWISSDKNSLPIIIGRIQVMLSDPQLNLPFPLRWFKRFALNQHPYLAPLIEEKAILANKLDSQKQDHAYNLAKLQQDKKEDLDLASNNLQRSGTFILTFCDELSATSDELAEKYISAVPDRADKVARDYIEKNISSDEILSYFPTFISHVHSLLIDAQAEKVAKKRYGHWLNETTIPTYDQLIQIPPSAQRRFKEFVVYSKTYDWAKQGLINQPQLPDILRVP